MTSRGDGDRDELCVVLEVVGNELQGAAVPPNRDTRNRRVSLALQRAAASPFFGRSAGCRLSLRCGCGLRAGSHLNAIVSPLCSSAKSACAR